MRLIRSVAAFAAVSMVAVPALAAAANPAAGLSLSSGAQTTGSTKHSGKVAGSTLVLIGVAAAAVVGGAVALGTHHDSMPASS